MIEKYVSIAFERFGDVEKISISVKWSLILLSIELFRRFVLTLLEIQRWGSWVKQAQLK